ncbi:hypothetical protein [Desulfotomaculum sp. 1211_IL3151]
MAASSNWKLPFDTLTIYRISKTNMIPVQEDEFECIVSIGGMID